MPAIQDIQWFKDVMEVYKAKRPDDVRSFGILANRAEGLEELYAKLDDEFPIDGSWADVHPDETVEKLNSHA